MLLLVREFLSVMLSYACTSPLCVSVCVIVCLCCGSGSAGSPHKHPCELVVVQQLLGTSRVSDRAEHHCCVLVSVWTIQSHLKALIGLFDFQRVSLCFS